MLLLHDSWAKELARVISALYQENYRKFEAHMLTSGMKPSVRANFRAIVCFVHNFIWNQKGGHGTVAPLAAPLDIRFDGERTWVLTFGFNNALFFNKCCLTEFAGSRTAALRTTALLHVFFIALHFVINYALA